MGLTCCKINQILVKLLLKEKGHNKHIFYHLRVYGKITFGLAVSFYGYVFDAM